MKFNPSLHYITTLHYNIQSIGRHIDEFRMALSLYDFKYDIICISESKLQKYSEPKIDINIEGPDPCRHPNGSYERRCFDICKIRY